MTSTEFTAGIGEGCRISSKVLKPPGGGSSNIFGLDTSQKTQTTQNKPISQNEVVNSSTHGRLFGHSENSQKPMNPPNEKLPVETKKFNGKQEDAHHMTSKSCNNNPIQAGGRIKYPPGGKSSGIF